MRVLTILVASLALVAGGCGDSGVEGTATRLSERLGGHGEQDAEVVGEFSEALGPVPDTDIAIVESFVAEDVAAAQKQVDRLRAIAADAKTIGGKAETAKLRDFLTGYADGVAGVADAYQRVIDRPNATDAEITKDMTSAKDAVLRFDTRYAEALRAALPADERKELDDHARRIQKEFQEAAEGGG